MNNFEESGVNNYVGGDSLQTDGQQIFGGDSDFVLNPMGTTGSTGGFVTEYRNIALTRSQFRSIEATFQRFNNPTQLKFIRESLRVIQGAETYDTLDLKSFFHPLQNFSNYQKQTIVIYPETSFTLDPGSFSATNGEISLLIAKAEYLPESEEVEQVLFWDYKANERNIMGKLLVLTGAIKRGSSWRGWDVDPYPSSNNTGIPNGASGGFIFTNPTTKAVKLTIITAN